MVYSLVRFLVEAVIISLSGVMAPGPITAATLAAGARRRHAGAWIAAGHGIVEFPLMGLIMAGAGVVLKAHSFRIGVGLAGGACLILLAGMMLAAARRPGESQASARNTNPLWTGIVLTGGNPYFLLWWATVGLTLTTRAKELGVLAFGLFAVTHWLCDLVWLEFLSRAANRGTQIFGPRSQRVILLICSAAMTVFGIMFLADAIGKLRL